MLTQEILKELIHYSPDTGVFTWKFRDRKWFKSDAAFNMWNTRWTGKIAGSDFISENCGKPYRQIKLLSKMHLIHRLAFLYMEGSFPSDDVDHINGNGTDNRWINLRSVTRVENARNVKLLSSNTSGHAGVGWDVHRNKWRARITVNNKTKHLGRFDRIQEAVDARKHAEIEYDFHPNHGQIRPL